MDELSRSLAATVQQARVAQDLSVNALAERSGVSRAMIGKIERGEAQPTAVLLGKRDLIVHPAQDTSQAERAG